jgi:hypothetical protein
LIVFESRIRGDALPFKIKLQGYELAAIQDGTVHRACPRLKYVSAG